MKKLIQIINRAFFVALICIALGLPSPTVSWIYLSVAMGIVCGQVALLATWMVFGSRRKRTRFFGSLGGLTLIGIAFCAYVIRTNGPPEVCVFSFVAFFLQWALIQIPFGLTQLTGWRIVRHVGASEDEPVSSQFQIWHLFAWTTGVAVLLGLGQMLPKYLPRIDNYLGDYGVFFAFLPSAMY